MPLICAAIVGPGAGKAPSLALAGAGSLSSVPALVAPVPELPLLLSGGICDTCAAGWALLLTAAVVARVEVAGGGLTDCIRPIDTTNVIAPVARLAACWRSL